MSWAQAFGVLVVVVGVGALLVWLVLERAYRADEDEWDWIGCGHGIADARAMAPGEGEHVD